MLRCRLFLLTLFLGLSSCKITLVETDCLKVLAAEVERDGGRVSARSVRFYSSRGCDRMTAVRYTAFRERNGIPGFQPDADPADVWVNHATGNTGDQPTTKVIITNVTNEGASGGFADSWEAVIELEDGSTSSFTGNF